MYGTREELCVQLENMFTFDEPLVLLVWTEEGISVACREAQPEPDGTEIRNLMKAIGEMKMTQYRQEGVNNLTVSDLPGPSAGSGKPSGECSGGTPVPRPA
nr:hypothetical protein [Enterobacter ludwigii]